MMRTRPLFRSLPPLISTDLWPTVFKASRARGQLRVSVMTADTASMFQSLWKLLLTACLCYLSSWASSYLTCLAYHPLFVDLTAAAMKFEANPNRSVLEIFPGTKLEPDAWT